MKIKFLFFILTCGLLTLPACQNHNDGDGGPPRPVAAGADSDLCWTQTPDLSQWVRINSSEGSLPGGCGANPKNANLNIYTWHKYSDDPVGKTLNVCADSTLPENWQQPIAAFHDSGGCDAKAHDSNYNNIRQYRRVS